MNELVPKKICAAEIKDSNGNPKIIFEEQDFLLKIWPSAKVLRLATFEEANARGLANLDFFIETSDGRFVNTAPANLLRLSKDSKASYRQLRDEETICAPAANEIVSAKNRFFGSPFSPKWDIVFSGNSGMSKANARFNFELSKWQINSIWRENGTFCEVCQAYCSSSECAFLNDPDVRKSVMSQLLLHSFFRDEIRRSSGAWRLKMALKGAFANALDRAKPDSLESCHHSE